MNRETSSYARRDPDDQSDGMAPARGAVFGLLFGTCFWLLIAAAVACWKFAACAL
jgi:hypothetical protein